MKFIPDSVLLNNIYLPFYSSPKTPKSVPLTGSGFIIDIGANGLNSVINPIVDDIKLIPFIDLNKWDIDSKDWLWYDPVDNFPYQLKFDDDSGEWRMSSMWEIITEGVGTVLTVPNKDDLEYDETAGIELGIYTTVKSTTAGAITSIKFYKGSPISLVVEGSVVRDITDYSGGNRTPKLTDENIEANKEFYFDPILNKIHTNLNLDSYSPQDIKLQFNITVNELSVKCRMSSNSGKTAYYTPTVDYYIVKLNGQHLRG